MVIKALTQLLLELMIDVHITYIVNIQRIPALRVFWDLEKTVLHETRASGTVLWSPTKG